MGPTYYMRLKHMVKDKINYRARGPNTVLTRQPVQGRANDGGLRIGEMERDGVLAHGMSYFLNESFMIRAEKTEYYLAICNKSGAIAIYNEAKNLFLSPYADGPIQFSVNPDGSQNIKNLSRFGRSFSIIRVPYALKLLIQELQVMNVQMRIITDENVDQLVSMSYSNNMTKLLKKDEELSEKIIKDYTYNVKGLLREADNKKMISPVEESDVLPEPVVIETPEQENIDLEAISGENTSESAPYTPGSPAVLPITNNPDSPAYAPGSPAYAPDSPAILPVTNSSVSSTDINIQGSSEKTILDIPSEPEEKQTEEGKTETNSSDKKVIIQEPSEPNSESSSTEIKKITI